MAPSDRQLPAPVSRRAALRRAAGGAALAAGLVAPSAASDAGLFALESELRDAEAAWQLALDELARTEKRLIALRPTPPAAILVPDPAGGAPVVPVRWPTLRKHLVRHHGNGPDLATRLAETRAIWQDYQRALAHASDPAWLTNVEAAEAHAATRVEALHRRLAATPAQGWPGVRLKLAVLWSRLGPARDDRDDDDLDAALLKSALADATHAAARSRVSLVGR